MKATKIFYQKCFSLGNYQNEVIGVELEINEGEKAFDALKQARNFVELNSTTTINKFNREKEVAVDKEFTVNRVEQANRFIKQIESETDDLPF